MNNCRLERRASLLKPHLILVVLASLAIGSCSGEQQPTTNGLDSTHGDIAVSVQFPQQEPSSASSQPSSLLAALGAPTINCTNLGIGVMRVDVINASDLLVASASFSCESGEGTVTGVPVGGGYKVVVNGSPTLGGAASYQGSQNNITVSSTETTTMAVTVNKCFTSLSFQPTDLTIRSGQKVNMAQVLGNMSPGQESIAFDTIAFSSDAPNIASVEGGGLITGTSSGLTPANITASYGGAMGTIGVIVVAGGRGLSAPFELALVSSSSSLITTVADQSATFALKALSPFSSSPVDLTGDCPNNFDCNLSTSTVQPTTAGASFDLTITANASVLPGIQVLSVIGTQSGSPFRKTIHLGVNILPPSGALPGSNSGVLLTVSPLLNFASTAGSTATYTFTAKSQGGSSSQVGLTLAGCPPQTTCTIPSTITATPAGGTAQLVVTTSKNSPLGSVPLTLSASAGSASAPVLLSIEDSAPGAFISATASGHLRFGHTATQLTTGNHTGEVLVVGGQDQSNQPLASVQLFNPNTGTWADELPLPFSVGRAGHTATLLDDGRVLIAGGTTASTSGGTTPAATETCLVYDPNRPQRWFTNCRAMNSARRGHQAIKLVGGSRSGQILVAGGEVSTSTTTEVFDIKGSPSSSFLGLWTSIAGPSPVSLTALEAGRTLAVTISPPGTAAQVYDPGLNAWGSNSTVTTQLVLLTSRATSLTSPPTGKVLVTGGGILAAF